MQLHRHSSFQQVELHQFGWAPVGKPAMTVFCFYLDGLLIDTAQAHCERKVLGALRGKPLHQIALTHWHEDHTGNVAALQKAYHPEVFAAPYTIDLVTRGFDVLPYEQYFFGKIKPANTPLTPLPALIQTEHYALLPIFTPGHSTDHHVFLERQQGWLFAGDLFVGVKIKFFRKGENIYQQIASLKTVLHHDFEVVFCGHNPQLRGGKQAMAAKLQYFEDLVGEVSRLRQRGMSLANIMSAIGKREQYLLRWLTFGDVSVKYLIASAVHDTPASR